MAAAGALSRAHGEPLFAAQIRVSNDDFTVTELLEPDCSDDGEHDWLWLEKTGANTHWVARRLASHAGVHLRDVGFAGLKDRHAVTRQWFSVRRAGKVDPDWRRLDIAGVQLLEQRRHRRKLRRGMHQGNAFRIALRGMMPADAATLIDARMATIATLGVPNYFGPQRFGHDGGNLELGKAVLDGQRLSRQKRSLGLSALRSQDFNEQLDERVRAGTWNRVLNGDVVNLDGSGSIFAVDVVTPDIESRCRQMDLHPCGLLPAFENLGVESGRRALRMRVSNLSWAIDGDALWLEFNLRRGCFATSVLREIAATDSARK